MKKSVTTLKTLSAVFAAFALAACAPSSKQLKEAIEKDPSIVFVAIEKDPEKFIEVVNKAAQEAQKKAQDKAVNDEQKQRDEEFANPLKPEIEADRPIFGKADAPITIVEYSDFECPYCSKGYQTMKEVMKEYGDKVRIVFKHLPLDFHPKAFPAAKYFVAIAKQGTAKAEKYHNLIFEDQNSLRSKGEVFMKEAAKKAGADMKKLEADLQSAEIAKLIDKDMEEAKKFGFNGTPGFIINGVSLKGAYPFPAFKDIIDRHLAKK